MMGETAGIEILVDVSVHDPDWPKDYAGLAEKVIRDAARAVPAVWTGPGEISVVLTDDSEQKVLNARYRGKKTPTNVLSFPQIEPFAPVSGLLGDIVVARETVFAEALEMGLATKDHFSHLIVHGFLHLLGYDHVDDSDAALMEGIETKILAGMGIADPYG